MVVNGTEKNMCCAIRRSHFWENPPPAVIQSYTAYEQIWEAITVVVGQDGSESHADQDASSEPAEDFRRFKRE